MRDVNHPRVPRPHRKFREKTPLTMAESILLQASIIITKRNDDKWSPYLKPRKIIKKPDGLPFTKREKNTEEIQCAIQERNFSPKPHLLNK